MLKKSIKRRFVTLIEMMIVMFLIALITGVIAYNYRGSLDEGKAFKTRTGMQRIETILNLELAKNPELQSNVSGNWKKIIQSSPLVNDPNALIKDGWGEDYQVDVDNERDAIVVYSKKYEEYKKQNQSLFNDR